MDFVAIDVETANYTRGSICSIGWAEVVGGQLHSAGSMLCRPPESLDWFESYLTDQVHGIGAGDVAGLPRFDQVWEVLLDVIDGRPVIAHNAPFDIGAIRSACTASGRMWPSLTYGCTLSLSRRLLDLPSHSLPIVSEYLGVTLVDHHDAAADATAAASVLLAMARRVGAVSLDELLSAARCAFGQVTADTWRGPRALPLLVSSSGGPATPTANLDANPSNPFFGQQVCFTGGLSSMLRREAWEAVAGAGGQVNKSTTKKTSILVIGDGFTSSQMETLCATQKAQKALVCRAAGQAIELWDERQFLAAVQEVFAVAADGTLSMHDDSEQEVPAEPGPPALHIVPTRA